MNAKLKVRAALHGRSMEEEAREILKCVLVAEEPRAQNREVVFTTAITQAEILYAVEMLPVGKRRSRLHAAVD